MNVREVEETTSAGSAPDVLGDFTATPRLIMISAAAMVIGVISSFVAVALLQLIGLFTNLFYYQRWATNRLWKAFQAIHASDEEGGTRDRAIL